MKKIISILLITILIASVFTLTSCGFVEYDWEFNSHEEYVNYIDNYNSLHDLYVETFISFDLDDNENVTKSVYYIFEIIDSKAKGFIQKNGYLCDMYSDGLAKILIYYLKGEGEAHSDYAYKIKCNFSKVPFNFTSDDEIKIEESSCTYYSESSSLRNDEFYEDSLITISGPKDEDLIYNHVYHYSLYVKDTIVCCIHISSIEEASQEKLDEIIQMLYESLEVINTGKFIIWRDKE